MSDGGEKAALSDEAFVTQMTACQRDLRAYILGLVPHQVDADDLLQEVNLALWRKRDLYNPEHDFLRWAFGFASLQIRSFKSRSAKRRLWFSEATIAALSDDWHDAAAFREDCNRALARCLQKLGHAERDVVEARYRDRKSMKQIASDSSRPLSTVYKILNRAVASLRECVKRS